MLKYDKKTGKIVQRKRPRNHIGIKEINRKYADKQFTTSTKDVTPSKLETLRVKNLIRAGQLKNKAERRRQINFYKSKDFDKAVYRNIRENQDAYIDKYAAKISNASSVPYNKVRDFFKQRQYDDTDKKYRTFKNIQSIARPKNEHKQAFRLKKEIMRDKDWVWSLKKKGIDVENMTAYEIFDELKTISEGWEEYNLKRQRAEQRAIDEFAGVNIMSGERPVITTIYKRKK